MGTFALDASSSSAEIVEGLNYAISNLGTSISNGLVANVLVANITTGEITTTSSNSSGYTNTNIVSYLYQYMAVKYANTSTGSSGFTSNSRLANYYGLRNSANTAISSNPVDYVWFQAAGGFGTDKSLWYQTVGGRQIEFFVGNAAPANSYITVPDMPLSTSTPLNLDTITSAQNNQIVNVNAYYQANTAPGTPAGGSYNFTTFTLTAPAGWSDTIPGFVANTTIYISQAAFVGNTNATSVPPATLWTVPAVYSSQFQGNTGAEGPRGFLPMGFVITASDPTLFSNANLTTAFSSSRSNPSPPIGLGFAPIANDTAQFAFTNLFTGNTVTVVKQYDGAGWTTVVGDVISGGLFVPGSINANTLNANQIYALTIASTNANVGNIASPGFWLDNVTGDARFAGNTNIGNQLIIGANAVVGGNLNIGNGAVIGTNLTVGNGAVIGTNLTVGNGAVIGTNLTVGNNAVIGGNLSVQGLITQGSLANAVVTTNTIQNGAIIGDKIAANTITGNLIAAATITGDLIAGNTITGNLIVAATITGNLVAANTIQGSSIVAGSITANELAANVLTVGNIISIGATFNDVNSVGYWLNNVTGSVRFGGNTSIGNSLVVGNNLIVGNNAIVGGNISLGGLVYAGNLVANVVATTNVQADAITQSVYVTDDPEVNLISWTNGNTTQSNAAGYLWPYNTRGFGVGGGATIIPSTSGATTVGSNFGGRIQVQFQAYVNSATNPEYNLIELWKTGGSNFYKNSFRRVRPGFKLSFRGGPTGTPENFLAVGQNGATFAYNWPSPNSGTTANVNLVGNSIWSDLTNNSSSYWACAPSFGIAPQPSSLQPPTYEYDWGFNDRFGPDSTGGGGTGVPFTQFGVGVVYADIGDAPGFSPNAYDWLGYKPSLAVGAGGNIMRYTMGEGDAGGATDNPDYNVSESSGVFADLYDVAFDRGPTYAGGTSVVTVVVGTGGTILRDVRNYYTYGFGSSFNPDNGKLQSQSGWTQQSSGTSNNLHAVGSNGNNSTLATLWVAVGDNGTILTSTTGSGWTVRTSGTTNNLYGVTVFGTAALAVGENGIMLYSSDSGVTWTSISNPAATNGRNLYSVTASYYGSRLVAVGDEIIMSTTNPTSGWSATGSTNGYLGGASVSSQLTRLQFYGSWANIANVSLPPAQQRVTNGQVVSGTYTDTSYVASTPVTYYLVLGNMAGNVDVYTGGPALAVTEFKR